MKHSYSIESHFNGKWVRLLTDTRDFCLGYLTASGYNSPRNSYRLIRGDGKVLAESPSVADVGIGMIAGWPTAEQYELAARRALEQADRIRKQSEKHNEANQTT